ETKIPGVMWEKRLLYRTGVAIFWPASAQTGTITPHSDLNTGRFMQISKHKVVAIDYTLTAPDGAVLDSSGGREPLAYLHGAGNIIAGLEAELEGKTRGDKLDVTVAPAEGYGERNEALIQQVPRSMFEGVDKSEPGMRFNAMSDAGPRVVVVTAVDDDGITIDGNHPLAGMELHFAVTIMDVRDATEEELEHDHVHGAGGHQH